MKTETPNIEHPTPNIERRIGRLAAVVGFLMLFFSNVALGQLQTTPFIRSILTNTTAGQTRTNLGAIGLPELTNANTLYVQLAGNNATALKANSGRPWASISNALVAVGNNENVLISAGDYNNHKGFVAHQVGGYATFKLFNLTNVHIRGSGVGTRIGFTNYGTCFFVSNCNNVTISDMSIFGKAPIATGIDFALTNLFGVIEVENSTNCTFERLHIENHGDQGIYHYSGPNLAPDCIVCDNVFINLGSWGYGNTRYDGAAVVAGPGWTVERNEVHDCARGIEPFAQYGSFKACRILNNKIFNCLDEAIAFGGEAVTGPQYGYWTGGEISGNYIEYIPGHTRLGSNAVTAYALSIHNASNIVVRGNQVKGAPHYGIVARNAGASNMTHIVIEENIVSRSGEHGIGFSADSAGKSINNSTIRQNQVWDTFGVGIFWFGTNNVVELNTIHNWGLGSPGNYPAMDCQLGSGTGNSNSIIRFNRIYDDQVVRTGGVGIQLDSGIQKVLLAGNIIQGGLGVPIENNAGSELLSDDYGKSIGGTNITANLLVTNNVQLAGRTASSILRVDASKNVGEVTIGANLSFDGTTLSGTGGAGSGESNVLANAGLTNATRIGLVGAKVGVTNKVATLSEGSNVTLTRQYDGSGNITNVVVAAASGGSFTNEAVGPISSVQFNSNSVFGGSAEFVFNPTNGFVGIGPLPIGPQARFHVGDAGGVLPVSASTLGLFSQTDDISNDAFVTILSGNTGKAELQLGNYDSIDTRLSWDNAEQSLSIFTASTFAAIITAEGNLGIGVTNHAAKLHVAGNTQLEGLALGMTNTATDLSLTTNQCVAVVDSTGGTVIVGLPDTTTVADGFLYRVKNIGTGSVIVTNAAVGQKIDLGTIGTTLSTMQSQDFHKQGTNWWKF